MNLKQIAGEKAVEYVEDGMVVGLGSGSTAYFAIQKIGERVREGLKITGVCTSMQTQELADRWKIPYTDIDDVKEIDLTIDGADEIDPQGHGIKGGRGALLFEKVVAKQSRQNIWVVEEKKLVTQLGAFPLPVEIIPFGYHRIIDQLAEMGLNPELRRENEQVFLTDGGHFIVDLHLKEIDDPYELDQKLKQLTGVIDHGLFLGLVNKAVAAGDQKVEIITFR